MHKVKQSMQVMCPGMRTGQGVKVPHPPENPLRHPHQMSKEDLRHSWHSRPVQGFWEDWGLAGVWYWLGAA